MPPVSEKAFSCPALRSKAAARLELHPNTVYARLNRIRELSGLDARSYHALTDLLTVAEARAGAVPGA